MYNSPKKPLALMLMVIIFVVIIDQLTKHIVLVLLDEISTFKCANFLNIIKVWNRGVVFGAFSESNISPAIFIFFSIVTILVITYFFLEYNPVFQGFIIGGALGNLIDRFLFGQVFDFLDFYIGHWHYPTFNIADVFIVIGCIFFIFNGGDVHINRKR